MAKTRAIARRRPRRANPRRRSRSGFTLPVAVIAGFTPLLMETVNSFRAAGLDGASQALVAYTTGYSRWEGAWKFDYLLRGMGPVFVGMLAHKLAGKLGINRALAGSGIPWIRI